MFFFFLFFSKNKKKTVFEPLKQITGVTWWAIPVSQLGHSNVAAATFLVKFCRYNLDILHSCEQYLLNRSPISDFFSLTARSKAFARSVTYSMFK